MSCADIEPRVALHAGGDLDEVSARDVERHMATCEGCRDLLAALRSQREAMADWQAAAPSQDDLDDVRRGALAAISRGDGRRSFVDRLRFAPFRSVAWGSTGLAAAALLVFAVWTTMSRPQNVQPVQRAASLSARSGTQATAVPSTHAAEAPRRPVIARPPSQAMTMALAGIPVASPPPPDAMRRIEFQTADPNIRIIWLLPEQPANPERDESPARRSEPSR